MCKNNCNGCKFKPTKKMISVQIPEDLFNKVEAHAEESGLLTDDVIANAVYCHLVEIEDAK